MQRWLRPWWVLVLVCLLGVAVLAGIVLLVWSVPAALYDYVPDPKDRAAAEASTRNGFIAGLAGLAALGSLFIASRTYRLTQQGQITDRYTRAVEQLGSDKLDVRLGGIYALERIAKDSERDHPTVVEVLSAFVREHSDPAHTDSEPSLAKVLSAFLQGDSEPTVEQPDRKPKINKPTTDVRAAIAVLGRLPSRLNVPRADLWGVDFLGAALGRANLSGFRLTDADLRGAGLREADLQGANLQEANLRWADVQGTNLRWANLQGADLWEANLKGANLRTANLQGVDLTAVRGLIGEQLTSSLVDAGTLPLQPRESDSAETRQPDGQ